MGIQPKETLYGSTLMLDQKHSIEIPDHFKYVQWGFSQGSVEISGFSINQVFLHIFIYHAFRTVLMNSNAATANN